MQIESGKLYSNRTYKYLFPVVKHYGEELTNYLRYFFKLGVGLADDNKTLPAGCLYILLDTNPPFYNKEEYLKKLDKFLNWFKLQEYYVADYVFCLKKDCSSHMIVIDFPREYNNAYIKFILSKYSLMYTKEQIDEIFPIKKLFNNEKTQELYIKGINHTRNILLKEDETEFLSIVNRDFETNLKHFSVKGELDYPVDLKDEIFNFKKVK